ncbi:MAG: hypothetical protein EPN37_05825 [Chitinophagaceae bacterium]|nr:MAG: hypothetical protein EPN37_05825 [Chitinophagaceae bacterium]
MKINMNNYEEFMLSFVDNELSEEDTGKLMQFLEQHQDLQRELRVLQATKLPSDEKIIFPDKDLLYRKEAVSPKKAFFTLRSPWVPAAAAACLALLLLFSLHPWKRQVVSNATSFNASPKREVFFPSGSPLTESLHEEKKVKQSEGIALRPAEIKKKNNPVPPSKKESNLIAKGPEAKKAGLAVMPALPDIPSSVNENKEIALNGNDLPKQLPLENTMHAGSLKKTDAPESNKYYDGHLLASDNGSTKDISVTEKIDEWRKKPGEILENIHQKGIKIGKITFAVNN